MDRFGHAPPTGEIDHRPSRFVGGMGSGHPAESNSIMTAKGHRSEVSGQRGKSGAAILLALWALFLLSALVISWALDINSRLAISGQGTRMLQAEAVACSGAEVALNPV